MMKSPAGNTTSQGVEKNQQYRVGQSDSDRNLKRVLGIVRKLDTRQNGLMYVDVDVPTGNNTYRAFGNGRIPVVISDSPTDILLRWGGLAPGMLVEVFYR